MPKKNSISYIKPQEPAFIARMKAAIGYKEGDTIETKRQTLPSLNDEDIEDRDEEQPVVVVLGPGDVSAEEAERIRLQEKEDAEQTPADLGDRIVFRAPPKTTEVEQNKRPHEDGQRGKRKKHVKNKSLLSFDDGENDDDS